MCERLAQQLADRAQLGGLGHHRDEQAEIGGRAGVENRHDLRHQRVRRLQQQLDATPPDPSQEWRGLVAAEVEDPHGGGPSGEPRQQRFENAAMLVRRRPPGRFEKGELGAKQADTVGTGVHRDRQLAGSSTISRLAPLARPGWSA